MNNQSLIVEIYGKILKKEITRKRFLIDWVTRYLQFIINMKEIIQNHFHILLAAM